mmetsp:Transcript_25760/g.57022  ORF Transcript_25760/g.57022 Transcript_25760/m.57022 type:complete len:238 (-) Transcript_25760:646-1359(-)
MPLAPAAMLSISYLAAACSSIGPVMVIVRVGGIEPTSAACGTCTRTLCLDWISRTVRPPRPMIAPTRSLGTITSVAALDCPAVCCWCCCRHVNISICAASTHSLVSAPMEMVRTLGSPSSGPLGICTFARVRSWMPLMVEPPLPIIMPTLSLGTGSFTTNAVSSSRELLSLPKKRFSPAPPAPAPAIFASCPAIMSSMRCLASKTFAGMPVRITLRSVSPGPMSVSLAICACTPRVC